MINTSIRPLWVNRGVIVSGIATEFVAKNLVCNTGGLFGRKSGLVFRNMAKRICEKSWIISEKRATVSGCGLKRFWLASSSVVNTFKQRLVEFLIIRAELLELDFVKFFLQ